MRDMAKDKIAEDAAKNDVKDQMPASSQEEKNDAKDQAVTPSQAAETYTVEEFMEADEKLWPDKKTRPSRYLIATAFRMNGKTSATREDGMRMVNEFANRKVN